MKKQLKSFGYAFGGIARAICTEAHMRFHLVAAFYVLIFSLFYNFSAAQYAVLLILIALIIAAELLNTAIENVCDLVTSEQNSHVKIAKDMAAGAVLVLSIAAAVIACVFFINLKVIAEIFGFFASNPLLLALLIISAVAAVIFVWLGPDGIRNKLFRKRNK
ncbi:MAG TPA: diacylglycerol kinase [Ruminococcaceae bacterium]|nr:diacylglycerol kinase [Oscillospiraceae bacterium]